MKNRLEYDLSVRFPEKGDTLKSSPRAKKLIEALGADKLNDQYSDDPIAAEDMFYYVFQYTDRKEAFAAAQSLEKLGIDLEWRITRYTYKPKDMNIYHRKIGEGECSGI